MLVQRAVGYLAAARNGLTEEELLDVLSADPEFMADFIDRSPTERAKRERGEPILGRLPIAVWSRLYYDLEPYLTERQADQTILLAFYYPGNKDCLTSKAAAAVLAGPLFRPFSSFFSFSTETFSC
jgi:hypothetical protein